MQDRNNISSDGVNPDIKPNTPRDSAERPYYVHRDWRRYFGQQVTPVRLRARCYSKFEAVSILWNEYAGGQFDVPRYAEEFNWSEIDVRAFIAELEQDGVFDNLKTEV